LRSTKAVVTGIIITSASVIKRNIAVLEFIFCFLFCYSFFNIIKGGYKMHNTDSSEVCCPAFDPAPWDERSHVWEEKLFIKDIVPQLFHIPLPWSVNRTIKRMWDKANEAKAAPDIKDFMILAYDPSPWKSEFYMAVTNEISGAENVKLTGTFLSKVFDGPYNAVPKWIKEMDNYVKSKGKTVKKYYFYYTTCPKCAKKYGHNYVVAFAQVEG
jgi:hypothetical protein